MYGYFNYGNRLQSYAVQQVLKGLGFDTEVIYVQSPMNTIRSFLIDVYFSDCFQFVLRSPDTIKNKYIRQERFKEFNRRFINAKAYTSVDKINDKAFDYFVLGSDQVWNPKRYDEVKKKLFFLTFTDSSKKVCFAPSFGVSELPDLWKPYFKKELTSFPLLSVREETGRDIIKQLTGREAEVMIDPTLMISREEWLGIINKPKDVDLEKEYVLNYFIGGQSEKAKDKSRFFSNEYCLEVYDLLDSQAAGLYTSGPSEFLYLINNAKLIQTDSFHACVFSFLFGKPFLLYSRVGEDADMISRLETMFSIFDLKRKHVESGLPNNDFECDYSVGFRKLVEERSNAIHFLKKSMKLE